MNMGGFSWKRFTGVSAAKSRIFRAIGIPLSKSGREQKIGRMITRGGCLVVVGGWIVLALAACCVVVRLI